MLEAGTLMKRIGTAGWAVPRAYAEHFPLEGSGLARYAAVFGAAEINSTFYRPHRASTYQRWADTVPDGFSFSAKMPKAMTHEQRLADCGPLIETFLSQVRLLGDRLGPLLIQLAPSLAFDEAVVAAFLSSLRDQHDGPLACEPRHASWFDSEADELLAQHRVARVAADPAKAPGAEAPGGWPGMVYRRLHGSPRVYYSSYEPDYLEDLTRAVAADPPGSWCIFDNTTSGAATINALTVRDGAASA